MTREFGGRVECDSLGGRKPVRMRAMGSKTKN